MEFPFRIFSFHKKVGLHFFNHIWSKQRKIQQNQTNHKLRRVVGGVKMMGGVKGWAELDIIGREVKMTDRVKIRGGVKMMGGVWSSDLRDVLEISRQKMTISDLHLWATRQNVVFCFHQLIYVCLHVYLRSVYCYSYQFISTFTSSRDSF